MKRVRVRTRLVSAITAMTVFGVMLGVPVVAAAPVTVVGVQFQSACLGSQPVVEAEELQGFAVPMLFIGERQFPQYALGANGTVRGLAEIPSVEVFVERSQGPGQYGEGTVAVDPCQGVSTVLVSAVVFSMVCADGKASARVDNLTDGDVVADVAGSTLELGAQEHGVVGVTPGSISVTAHPAGQPGLEEDGSLDLSACVGHAFADVLPDHQFFDAIEWMFDSGTSTGSVNPDGGKPLFKPLDVVRRQAMGAFLYRLAGSPAVSGTPHFADVPVGHQFFDALQWMFEAGVSTGSVNPDGGKPLFKPLDVVRRQAMGAFLYRLEGSPAVSGTPHFADVGPGHQFFDALQWMFESGTSTGSVNPAGGDPLFKPSGDVLRQAMAAFLYRIHG